MAALVALIRTRSALPMHTACLASPPALGNPCRRDRFCSRTCTRLLSSRRHFALAFVSADQLAYLVTSKERKGERVSVAMHATTVSPDDEIFGKLTYSCNNTTPPFSSTINLLVRSFNQEEEEEMKRKHQNRSHSRSLPQSHRQQGVDPTIVFTQGSVQCSTCLLGPGDC
jgi:hypothetical protein